MGTKRVKAILKILLVGLCGKREVASQCQYPPDTGPFGGDKRCSYIPWNVPIMFHGHLHAAIAHGLFQMWRSAKLLALCWYPAWFTPTNS